MFIYRKIHLLEDFPVTCPPLPTPSSSLLRHTPLEQRGSLEQLDTWRSSPRNLDVAMGTDHVCALVLRTCQDVASLSWRNCNWETSISLRNKFSWFQTTLSSRRPLQDTTGSWNHLTLLSSELRNLWIINSWSGPPKTFQHPPNSLRVCICSRKTNPLEKEWNPPSTSQDVFLDVALSETWLPRTELVTRVVHHMFRIAKNLGVNPQFSDTQYIAANVMYPTDVP
jgi:hypothetical protein